MKSELIPALACPAAALLAAGIGCVVLVLRLRRSMASWLETGLTRKQHTAFVLRLRDLVFQDPFRFMNMLCSKEAQWFVSKLCEEVGDACAREGRAGGAPPAADSLAAGVQAAHPVRLPDDGMAVEKYRMQNGSIAAIVKLPEPKLSGETFLIGVVLPPDESLKEDVPRARRLVHYFIVNRWEGNRTTDFCEWTVKGKELTYNVGAPLDPRAFARTIDAKLQETLQRHAAERGPS